MAATNEPEQLSVGNQQVFFTSSEDLHFLPDGVADFVITSPPYWNLKDYGHPGQIGPSSYGEYHERLKAVWRECHRVTGPDAVMLVNAGSRRQDKQFYPIAMDIAQNMPEWTLWDILIWYIPNALPQSNHYMERLFDNKYEFLLVFTKDHSQDYTFHKPRVPQKYIDADPRAHKKNGNGRCIGNVIRIPAYRPPNVKKLGYHIAAYPEELVALMLESFTDRGDVVLDPFLGSGTTLKVAEVMGRSGIGVEINGDYRELICQRIKEQWSPPDWRDVDILHSSTMVPGSGKPRKIHWMRQSPGQSPLSDFSTDGP